jgi:hypothetical protein
VKLNIEWDDSAQLDLTCPNCQHVFKVQFGRLRRGETIECPQCDLQIDAAPSAEDIRKL